MAEDFSTVRRRQFCSRCGQLMFEFYRSPDGHYGVVAELRRAPPPASNVILCPVCGARYRLLDRADSTGQVVARL